MNKSAQPLSGCRYFPPARSPFEISCPWSVLRLPSPLLKSCWRWCSLRVKRWTTFVDDSDSRSDSDSWQFEWHFALRHHLSAKCLSEFAHVTIICSNLKFTPASRDPPRQQAPLLALRINTSNRHLPPRWPQQSQNKSFPSGTGSWATARIRAGSSLLSPFNSFFGIFSPFRNGKKLVGGYPQILSAWTFIVFYFIMAVY